MKRKRGLVHVILALLMSMLLIVSTGCGKSGSGESSSDKKESQLNPKDERDIAKRLESTLAALEENQEALMFSGEPLDDETRELLKASLENSLKIAKINAKQKFTPKKYRNDNE